MELKPVNKGWMNGALLEIVFQARPAWFCTRCGPLDAPVPEDQYSH